MVQVWLHRNLWPPNSATDHSETICAITFVNIQLKTTFTKKKKKRLLAWKLLCKSQVSDQACLYFAFFVPSNVSVWVSVLLCHNKNWLKKVAHFWLMGMSVNRRRRRALQIEICFSIICTLVWFLMHLVT